MELLIIGAIALLTSMTGGTVAVLKVKSLINAAKEDVRVLEMKSPLNDELDMEHQFELDLLNTLYICNDCEEFTRQHIMELEMLKTELKTLKKPAGCCPGCGSTNYTEARESYGWQKTHRHCYEMSPDQLFEHKELVKKIRGQIKSIEDAQAFDQYERKHLVKRKRQLENNFKEPMTFDETGFNITNWLETEAKQVDELKFPEVNAMGLTPEEEAAKTMGKLKASAEGQEYLKPEPFLRPVFPEGIRIENRDMVDRTEEDAEAIRYAAKSFGMDMREINSLYQTESGHSVYERKPDSIEHHLYLDGKYYKIKWDDRLGRNIYIDEQGRWNVFSQTYIDFFKGPRKKGRMV